MSNELNILILSCGTRNKIVQYFKKELKGQGTVVATDCSLLAPALYEADRYYIVPKITEKDYINNILDICNKEEINVVISLIDPELKLLAENFELFNENGVLPIVSKKELIDICFNKFKMYNFLCENQINTVKSYMEIKSFEHDLENKLIDFPVFCKPQNGSASQGIFTMNTLSEVRDAFKDVPGLMVQEYMKGREYGVDVYIDLISKEVVTMFIKEKIKMRAGETDKSVSVKSEKIFKLVETFVKAIELVGVIDIDIFEKDNEFYISEVNPRFGGGYPHAYETGINIPKMIINNARGYLNGPLFNYKSGVYMMKYNDIKILKENREY